jgi:succinate dehydrogenase / fumarate reductase, iron-sulfur subunit
MAEAILNVFRGNKDGGETVNYTVPIAPGMVVLDALHYIQGHLSQDLAVRWNCKAGKCGSCSAEVNGRPRLTCKTRMDTLPTHEPITVRPIKKIPPFQPKKGTDWKFYQEDADRVQEFRKCIECFLCQNVCHVLRDHDEKAKFGGPRFFVRVAGLEMHPLDDGDRVPMLKEELGLGYCNITKCCTEVCPEEIHITDNAIIPLKERVVDRYYDPLVWIARKIGGK